ncbi:IS3 family transposase [Leptospira weilii]|uniref:IS3 family transposase n=1 Tax=Leptospira weilii TaxID=28184 RepID=UPI0002FC8654
MRILFEEHENRSGYLRIHQDLRSEGLDTRNVGESVPLSFLESFFKTLKMEEVYKRKFNNKETKYFLFDYIERYYNRRRRHSALGYLSPVEFRELPHPSRKLFR